MAFHTIEICAGVGMLGEGLRAGLAHMGHPLRTVAYLERETYPAACLAARIEEGSLTNAHPKTPTPTPSTHRPTPKRNHLVPALRTTPPHDRRPALSRALGVRWVRGRAAESENEGSEMNDNLPPLPEPEAMEHAKKAAEKYGSDWLPVLASGCTYPQCVSSRGCSGACGKTTVTK